MSSRPEDREDVRNANRALRKALHQCREMLQRAEDMIRQSRQDNDRGYTD